jgi:hypothetical protein
MERSEVIAQIRYGITKYSVRMEAVAAEWKLGATPIGHYVSAKEIRALAFAAPHRKLALQLSSIHLEPPSKK